MWAETASQQMNPGLREVTVRLFRHTPSPDTPGSWSSVRGSPLAGDTQGQRREGLGGWAPCPRVVQRDAALADPSVRYSLFTFHFDIGHIWFFFQTRTPGEQMGHY